MQPEWWKSGNWVLRWVGLPLFAFACLMFLAMR
jgi:hypothetical protein